MISTTTIRTTKAGDYLDTCLRSEARTFSLACAAGEWAEAVHSLASLTWFVSLKCDRDHETIESRRPYLRAPGRMAAKLVRAMERGKR